MKPQPDPLTSWLIVAGVAYPMFHEVQQFFKVGFADYFDDLGNWVDIIYLVGSLIMAVLHM